MSHVLTWRLTSLEYVRHGNSLGGTEGATHASRIRESGWPKLPPKNDQDAAEVVLQYKRLWMIEAWFRSSKSLLQTRPIYHKCEETIRGHVFCSFLALA